MRNSFQRVIATLNLFQGKQSLTIFMLAAFFALSACEDSSSAGGEGGSGGNRGGIPDTVETFMELSDYDCSKSQKCVATYLTEYHNMAVCDGDNGWVIGTLIEKMDCDFSSSSDKSSDSKSNDPAEVTDDSSDSKDNPSSAGTSTKSSNSNTSGNDAKSSSSAGKEVSSSSEEMKSAWDYLNPDIDYGEFTDERDGQVYKTVKIGDQVWMAENLNYETDDSYCYDNEPSNCTKYGRLYTWAAVMDSAGTWSTNGKGCGYGKTCSPTYPVRGVCPTGWHLPTTGEFETLFDAVGGQSTAAKMLKSTTGWNNDGNGTDAYGFSALPAGHRIDVGLFYNSGLHAHFWSATGNGSYYAYYMYLDYGNDDARLLDNNYKYSARSVRCIKDSD